MNDQDPTDVENRTYRKVARRIVPLLMAGYVGAYLDRVNVGFAKLQMMTDLGWSEAAYGFGAGVFFLGYFLFEVPSNLILYRYGARRWLARIMLSWAVISASFGLVRSSTAFYSLRFLLGVAEAGFAPGVILYLTYWFPARRRARMLSLFFMAIPIANIAGGPLSGWILQTMSGAAGLRGWQWLFVLEAIPSLVVGLGFLVFLDDTVAAAEWLTPPEKTLLDEHLKAEEPVKLSHASVGSFLRDGRVWLLAAIYFCVVLGQYGLTFWLPTIVNRAGVSNLASVGVLSAIPYVVALAAMPIAGMSSDRTRARRWHCAIPMLWAALALAALGLTSGVGAALALLSAAAAGSLVSSSLFWTLPTAFLGGLTAAAAVATINSLANLGGFVSPSVVGWLNDVTGTSRAGLTFTSLALLVGAGLVMILPRDTVDR